MERICIITAYTLTPGWKELGDFTASTLKEYVNRYRYDCKVFTDGFDVFRHPSWSKVLFVKNVLPSFSWIWWLDADAVITNQKIDIRKFLESEKDILVCKDAAECEFNMGSFFIRNCPFSFWLLDEMWSRTIWSNKPSWEQSALLDIFREGKVGDRMVIFGVRDFNSMCDWYAEKLAGKVPNEDVQWHVGDFVAHCVGYDIKHRLEILREAMNYAVR